MKGRIVSIEESGTDVVLTIVVDYDKEIQAKDPQGYLDEVKKVLEGIRIGNVEVEYVDED